MPSESHLPSERRCGGPTVTPSVRPHPNLQIL